MSAQDVPPFDRAAMDGFAVIAEDTFGAGRYHARVLRCIETVYTGQVPSQRLATGECIEIATGAPMPDGADAVVMVEETEKADDGGIRIFTPVYPRQHVGPRAADIAAGQLILASGQLLNPSRIGALAATGVSEVDVFARPRVAISRPATKSWSRDTNSCPARFTTSTSSRCHRSFVSMAACQSRVGQRQTT